MVNTGAKPIIEIPDSIREKTMLAIAGNSASLADVFEYYRPRLLAHALRICGNSPVARDAVQDSFITVFTHITTLRNPALFYPWLKKILVNNCYLLLRRERSVELKASHTKHESLIQNSIEEHLEGMADRQKLFESLRDLSEELRACVMLRYFTNFKSYDTIAQLLDLPVGTVRSRLSAAREKISALYRKKDDSSNDALVESKQWTDYYLHMYSRYYDDLSARNELLEHHHPELLVRYTSGSFGRGRKLIEGEVNNDLKFGSRFQIGEVVSCGNISVLEGRNENHETYPFRCAPFTAMVLFRNQQRIETVHIFDSARP